MGTKNIQDIIVRMVLSTCLLTACLKDKPAAPVTVTPQPTANRSVYVVCEGSFGNGEGTLYQYDPKTGSVSGDIYAAANNKAKVGDVFQSMVRIDNRLFLCINNSDKVIVINREDKKAVGTIGIPKPRYILPVSESKAYVSTLFSNKVYIINTQTLQVTGTIDMPYQNPEGMVMYNGKACICTWDTACGNLYTVDVTTDKIEQTISLNARAPQEALVDKNNKLWVVSGNIPKGKSAALTQLDDQLHIVKSYNFPAKADVIRPVFNAAKDVLYYIEVNYSGGTDYNGVYRININDADLPATPFVSAGTFQYFWGLGIDPVSDKIYIGDPKGFVQKGMVSVYNTDGKTETSFTVGLGPGHFFFD